MINSLVAALAVSFPIGRYWVAFIVSTWKITSIIFRLSSYIEVNTYRYFGCIEDNDRDTVHDPDSSQYHYVYGKHLLVEITKLVQKVSLSHDVHTTICCQFCAVTGLGWCV